MAMAVWVIRAGRMGENEEFALNEGVYSIGFSQERSVADFSDYESLRDYIHRQSDEWSLQQAASRASQLWRFVHDMQLDDMIVLPRKRHRVIAVGRITGNYLYNADESQAPLPHTRKVEWQVQDLPRANFDEDLKHSFTSQLTVSQVRKDNAEARIQQVVNVYLGIEQMTELPPQVSSPDDLIDDTDTVNLEESINDRIIERIRERFREHRLEYLVARILEAEGYTVLETRPGPDSGVDIVAGSGELGFGQPRLCVQVKSGQSPVGVADYRGLQGSVQNFGADHGLLVSLSGFTQPVHSANRQSFFVIRLWGPEELVENLLDTYDDLPLDIRTDIPLQSRRVLVEADE